MTSTATTLPQFTLHSRIREELRARIVSGQWQPHDRIPSESELMAAAHAAITTSDAAPKHATPASDCAVPLRRAAG